MVNFCEILIKGKEIKFELSRFHCMSNFWLKKWLWSFTNFISGILGESF